MAIRSRIVTDTGLSSVNWKASGQVELLTREGSLDLSGFGNSGHNLLDGGGENDIHAGGAYDDAFSGNDAANRIKGDAGKDIISGGAGADVLEFPANWDNDAILDFDPLTDKLELSLSGVALTGLDALDAGVFVFFQRIAVGEACGSAQPENPLRRRKACA